MVSHIAMLPGYRIAFQSCTKIYLSELQIHLYVYGQVAVIQPCKIFIYSTLGVLAWWLLNRQYAN